MSPLQSIQLVMICILTVLAVRNWVINQKPQPQPVSAISDLAAMVSLAKEVGWDIKRRGCTFYFFSGCEFRHQITVQGAYA